MSPLAEVVVLLRADSSERIGTGHVARCLALASALRRRGADCRFVSRSHLGHRNDLIRAQGFQVAELPRTGQRSPAVAITAHDDWLDCDWRSDARQTASAWPGLHADWLVVDHYALEANWERNLRESAGHMLVIDDLADRQHVCDVLLDQNLGRNAEDYADRVETSCQLLLGPQFALLREEFAREREASLRRRQSPALARLLVTMGGVDAGNATGTVLEALLTCSRLPDSLEIVVVMGSGSPKLSELQVIAARLPWRTQVLVDVGNMAELMRGSDLIIGAAGGTAWERCCLGVPTIAVSLARNQRGILSALQGAGAVLALEIEGQPDRSFAVALTEALSLTSDPGKLRLLSERAAALVDGQGAERVADVMAQRTGRV